MPPLSREQALYVCGMRETNMRRERMMVRILYLRSLHEGRENTGNYCMETGGKRIGKYLYFGEIPRKTFIPIGISFEESIVCTVCQVLSKGECRMFWCNICRKFIEVIDTDPFSVESISEIIHTRFIYIESCFPPSTSPECIELEDIITSHIFGESVALLGFFCCHDDDIPERGKIQEGECKSEKVIRHIFCCERSRICLFYRVEIFRDNSFDTYGATSRESLVRP